MFTEFALFRNICKILEQNCVTKDNRNAYDIHTENDKEYRCNSLENWLRIILQFVMHTHTFATQSNYIQQKATLLLIIIDTPIYNRFCEY